MSENAIAIPKTAQQYANVKLWLGIAGCFLGCVLTGFGQSTNRLIWQVPTGRYVFSTPALDRDGTIYIGFAIQASGELETSSWPAFGRDAQHTGRDVQRGIESIAETPSEPECLRLTVEPGRPYVIEGSTDLRQWDACTNIVSASTVLTVPRIWNYSYYRLQAPQ